MLAVSVPGQILAEQTCCKMRLKRGGGVEWRGMGEEEREGENRRGVVDRDGEEMEYGEEKVEGEDERR